MTDSPALRILALCKSFGARRALDGVDLEVPRGVAFGFLGPNGAGKTTVIRLALGLARPTAGKVELLGRRLPAGRADALARVGASALGIRANASTPRAAATTSRFSRPVRCGWKRGSSTTAPASASRTARASGPRLLARHAPAPRPRALPPRRPRAAHPRRADERARPRREGRAPGAPVRARGRGTHRIPLVAPARRGGAHLRRGGDRRSRTRGRPGPARRARRRPRRRGRDRLRGPRPRGGDRRRAARVARATADAAGLRVLLATNGRERPERVSAVLRGLLDAGIPVERVVPRAPSLEERFLSLTRPLEAHA